MPSGITRSRSESSGVVRKSPGVAQSQSSPESFGVERSRSHRESPGYEVQADCKTKTQRNELPDHKHTASDGTSLLRSTLDDST